MIKQDEIELSEINVTPFIDIMLVLLIVFMVVAPLITSSVKVELPKTSSQERQDEQKRLIVYINEEQISINETITSIKELQKTLNDKSKGNQKELVYFYVDKLVSYERLAEVINAVKEAGFTQIALATQINQK